jgi:putative hydrolase of HD superfamily
VCWIAQVIAARELAAGHLGANDVDMGKMVRMALVHDLPESRTGDVHYISRQYTQRNETLAQEDIFAHTSIGDDMCELLEEYEQRRSWEAKIVKDADNLDCDIELKELAAMGSTLDTSLAATRRHVYETQFFTESARELWLETQTADPHAWHKNGRNRMKSGDWKKNA